MEIDFSWILTILILLLIINSQIIISKFVRQNYKIISEFIVKESNESDPDEAKAKKAVQNLEKRSQSLGYITKITVATELLFFILAAILIFLTAPSSFEIIKTFGVLTVGWLGIKTLSSHPIWSNIMAGKAYYHISLIGSLLNIITGFVVGWLIYIAWFKIYN